MISEDASLYNRGTDTNTNGSVNPGAPSPEPSSLSCTTKVKPVVTNTKTIDKLITNEENVRKKIITEQTQAFEQCINNFSVQVAATSTNGLLFSEGILRENIKDKYQKWLVQSLFSFNDQKSKIDKIHHSSKKELLNDEENKRHKIANIYEKELKQIIDNFNVQKLKIIKNDFTKAINGNERFSRDKGLVINNFLLSLGITHVQTSSTFEEPNNNAVIFTIGNRTFEVVPIEDYTTQHSAQTLVKKLARLCSAPIEKIYGSANKAIINLERRQEVFFPFLPANTYIYPWLSKTAISEATILTNLHSSSSLSEFDENAQSIYDDTDTKQLQFNQFFSVGCMFGTTLKGVDNLNRAFEIIKHNIEFHHGQKIVKILFAEDEPNLYEDVLFKELEENLLPLVKKLANNKPSNLYYHLPYYDYMLFGIELYIRGRMTYDALEKFFEVIYRKQQEYKEKIHNLCSAHNITYKIESPFDNLFGNIDNLFCHADANFQPIDRILNLLGIAVEKNVPEIEEEQAKAKEMDLVHSCLKKLQTNTFNEEHQQTWQDFVNAISSDNSIQSNLPKLSNNLEELFKMANSIMIALACKEQRPYTTCTIMPVSEKQIAVTYDLYCRSPQISAKYPGVFNISTLDQVIAHDHQSKGSLFYFGSAGISSANEVVSRLLETARKNWSKMMEKVTMPQRPMLS